MIDDELLIPFDPPGPDLTYRHYLETCRRVWHHAREDVP
jgi:hypothetical protein